MLKNSKSPSTWHNIFISDVYNHNERSNWVLCIDCESSSQCLPLRIEHCLFGGLLMELVRITSCYPNFNGSHFGLPPSEIHRMTGLPPKIVWTMTYSHRPHLLSISAVLQWRCTGPKVVQPGAVKLVLWRHWMHAPELHASSDVREPISLHQAVHMRRKEGGTDHDPHTLCCNVVFLVILIVLKNIRQTP